MFDDESCPGCGAPWKQRTERGLFFECGSLLQTLAPNTGALRQSYACSQITGPNDQYEAMKRVAASRLQWRPLAHLIHYAPLYTLCLGAVGVLAALAAADNEWWSTWTDHSDSVATWLLNISLVVGTAGTLGLLAWHNGRK